MPKTKSRNQTSGDPNSPLAAVEDAIEAIGRGEIVVVVDDEDRENEGDLIMAAEHATPESIAFFVRYTSGVLCAPMTGERLDDLALPLMVTVNTEPMRTAYTITVDAAEGTTTGISASDRSKTLNLLAFANSEPHDFVRPGHVLPLRYRPGGVLKRAGHTEAAVDLARLAGCEPVGVLAEVVNEDGSMSRLPELTTFCEEHDLLLISIADLIRYRRANERLVDPVSQARIPTIYGDFTAHVFRDFDETEHLALVFGQIMGSEPVLVRVHSECLTGDVLASMRCDCGTQLHTALEAISEEGAGVLVYLRGHEGRGIGIGHKMAAYHLQDEGRDTVDANLELGLPVDSREYGIGAQILVELGVTKMRLMTNNPAKIGGLEGYGLEIVERVSTPTGANPENLAYLRTKNVRLGHMIEGLDDLAVD
ncbi:MAG: bifunctional 3,4-dihydroxy-2-butanone-4-phosphate synthase/GTP cyclohydrolase II [Actinomycetota bacterium]|jgi:3,4-dihydroxy 2-butanone 4-phosphate synthase/GTP cyclohydrolase II|nr:bifunctional 3,4-dihydroxy-2-butanone-4-phosphate synthase/GTP cyclohydrolase II [Acidimicrobiaceae bacterium]MEC7914867.1 bifunctional 3,4-dihydroxy-2-butanone-4-phosphate synthase/GTP cyclohydrolase II [Actinomycetota bacterium]MEE3256168.1 bifunctional 3,4-dihydroxy-2-butanone-4-phosphate synthase/GTP cyclohydrolase II [Actinomycetota bacterium]